MNSAGGGGERDSARGRGKGHVTAGGKWAGTLRGKDLFFTVLFSIRWSCFPIAFFK